MTHKGEISSVIGLSYPQRYGEERATQIRQKISEAGRNRGPVKESTRKKISTHRKKWGATKSKKERRIYALKGLGNRRSYVGSDNPNYGKKHPGINKGPKPYMRGQNNPMFNKQHRNKVGVGYRPDLGHRVKSSWEANFARIVKYRGYTYKYEETSFDLGNGYSYTPDFFVNEESCFYELKGYMGNRDTQKLSKFKALYPEIKLEIIDEKKYSELKDKYGSKIEWEDKGFRVMPQNFEFVPIGIDNIEISNSSKCGSRKKLYNLSVEDDESFIAEKVVNHNTGLYDLRGSPHYIYPRTAKFLVFRGKDGRLVFAKRVRGQKPRLYMNRALQQLDWALEDAWENLDVKGPIVVGGGENV